MIYIGDWSGSGCDPLVTQLWSITVCLEVVVVMSLSSDQSKIRSSCLTLKQLDIIFQNVIVFSIFFAVNAIFRYETGLIQLTFYQHCGCCWPGALAFRWCHNTTAVATVMIMHPCISSYLWVKLGAAIEMAHQEGSIICLYTEKQIFVHYTDKL